jgi:hypothetical protein
VDEKARAIDEVFLDLNLKMQAPDFIVPSQERIPKEKLLGGLRTRTDGIVAFARDHDLSFTCLDFELPGYGALTGQEWVHFLTTHTRRHLHQLKKIVEALKP